MPLLYSAPGRRLIRRTCMLSTVKRVCSMLNCWLYSVSRCDSYIFF